MEITEVRVTLRDDERLKGFITITFDGVFVVHGLKIIDGKNGLFVAMPSRKNSSGEYEDVAHPIHAEMRGRLEERVLAEYHEVRDEAGIHSS